MASILHGSLCPDPLYVTLLYFLLEGAIYFPTHWLLLSLWHFYGQQNVSEVHMQQCTSSVPGTHEVCGLFLGGAHHADPAPCPSEDERPDRVEMSHPRPFRLASSRPTKWLARDTEQRSSGTRTPQLSAAQMARPQSHKLSKSCFRPKSFMLVMCYYGSG